MKRLLSPIRAAIVLLSITTPLLAQLSTGSLSGSVTDPAGLAIPGATVKVTHIPTGRIYETVSSDAGLYAFPNLEVGPYTIAAEKPGFKKLERSALVISSFTR